MLLILFESFWQVLVIPITTFCPKRKLPTGVHGKRNDDFQKCSWVTNTFHFPQSWNPERQQSSSKLLTSKPISTTFLTFTANTCQDVITDSNIIQRRPFSHFLQFKQKSGFRALKSMVYLSWQLADVLRWTQELMSLFQSFWIAGLADILLWTPDLMWQTTLGT